MKTAAYVVHGAGEPFSLEEIELDELRKGEALIEMKATGLCHTDLMVASGTLPLPMPIILGHEGVGRIIALGDESETSLRKDDIVVLSFASCGACASCVGGHPAYCQSFLERNWSGRRPDGSWSTYFPAAVEDSSASRKPVSAGFFGQSSFSKVAIVDLRSCVKVTPKLLQSSDGTAFPLSHLAPFGCAFGTGAGTVLNVCKPTAGSSIAVYGAGAVGLAAIAAAANLTPATTIIAIDVVSERLEAAKSLGATACIQSRRAEPAFTLGKLAEATSGRGVDFAIDTTGSTAVIKGMLDNLAVNGLGLQLGGTSPTAVVEINPQTMINKGIAYKGVVEGDSNPQIFLPALIEHFRNGKFPIGALIKEYRYTELGKAAEDLKSGAAVKAVLVWD